MTLDANADFRQPGQRRVRTRRPPIPLELKAKEHDLFTSSWTARSVSSATVRLVMSTLDVVAYAGENHGGVKPANFLDIGGGASAEVMAAGLRIILGDEQVKSVFVNVFGGITSCDAVANGIVGALEKLGDEANKPLIVRLDGNNVEEGRHSQRSQPPVGHPGGNHGLRRRQGRRAGEQVREPTNVDLLNADSKVIVQGITGARASTPRSCSRRHERRRRRECAQRPERPCRTPTKPATRVELPVFGWSPKRWKTGANVSVAFVPPKFAKDAIIEAIDAEIPLLVVITEGIPVQDSAYAWAYNLEKVEPMVRSPASSARTARASSPQTWRWRASPRRTSPEPVRSAWCRSRAR